MTSSKPEQGSYKLLRGQRILNQLNEESSFNGLYREIERGFPDTRARQHATGEVAVANIKYVPAQGKLQVDATTRSNMHEYKSSIMFLTVQYEPQGGENITTFVGPGNAEYHIQPIDLSMSSVKVRCNCLDFFYRFATWNANDSSLLGSKPPLYQRVPGSTRPPVNPARVPGVCKHVIKTVDMLRRSGIVR
jgi:hypothetical protein